MQCFVTPSKKALIFIPRTGSTAFARAILTQFYPELLPRLTQGHFPAGRTEALPQFICPTTVTPEGPVYALIRDPIERFRSGFTRAANGRTVQQVIADLFDDTKSVNTHIERQSAHIRGYRGVKCYQFTAGMAALAAELGLSATPPQENASEDGEKPELTEAQVAKLREYYADDIKLYAAAVPAPQPDDPLAVPPIVTATQIRLWLVRNGVTMTQVDAAINAITDPQARAEAQVQWEYAPYVERKNPLVAQIAAGFNMNAAAIDAAFIAAAKL